MSANTRKVRPLNVLISMRPIAVEHFMIFCIISGPTVSCGYSYEVRAVFVRAFESSLRNCVLKHMIKGLASKL